MTFRIAALLGALVLWLAGLGAANAQAAQPEPLRPVVRCTSLGGIDLARATSATTAVSLLHEEGNGASAYCRVVGTIAPAAIPSKSRGKRCASISASRPPSEQPEKYA